jgi:penicillin-binding protein 2
LSEYFKRREPRELTNRLIYVTIFVAVAFLIIAIRLWSLQIMKGGHYTELSKHNRIRTVKSRAPRGIIYDRTGIKLADNRPGFDLYIVPEDVTDWDKTHSALKKLSALDAATIKQKLEKAKGRPPFQAVKLKEDLSWEETVKIESHKFELPGIILDVTPKRQYLYGSLFAHLIGYVSEINDSELKRLSKKRYRPGDQLGKSGIEKSYESALRGTDGTKEIEVDAIGRKIQVVNTYPPFPGNDVTLTVDIKTQLAAWVAMQNKAGAVIAMEPSTGRILAMLSTPGFSPNQLSSGISRAEWAELIGDPGDLLMNRAIQGLYPPASTYKPIHAIAALEEGVIEPSTMIHAGPSFRFGRRNYRDWRAGGHGTINVERAIIESADTFFYQVGLDLGIDKLAKYSRIFGFGKKTGIALGNEKSGLVPSSEWKLKVYQERWFEGETISVAVGQGYTLTTPLQLLNAYAAIANGGTLYKPKIVEEIKTASGDILKRFVANENSTLGVSEETLSLIKTALRGVVTDEKGTAQFLRWSRLKIAGKTGTAQVVKLIKRTKNIEEIPYKLRDHAWFAGYAPYDDPKIAVVVLVEHGGFGASAAAPVAQKLFRAYLGPPPKKKRTKAPTTAPSAL